MHNRGVSRLPVGKFQSHKAEKIRRGTLRVSKNLGDRKISCIRGRVYYDSPSESSFSHFPENFVGYPSLYDKISGNGRFFACGGNHLF